MSGTALLSPLKEMNIRAEFEQEKGGRWVAKIPGVREVVGYGSTRHQAAVGLTVSALHVLADRIKTGQVEVEEEPVRIVIAGAEDHLLLAAILFGLVQEGAHTPNAETIAAFEEYERDGGKSFDSVEELMAELDAGD
jgi:hypothetical protein